MSRYDAIVIGAGANGLTAAAMLAQSGRDVALLEARPQVGGLALSGEFHPGYRGTGPLHDTTGLQDSVVRGLELENRGLRLRAHRPDVLALGENGPSLVVPGDPEEAGRLLNEEDARHLGAFRDYVDRVRPLLNGWLDRPPPDPIALDRQSLVQLGLRGLDLRRLGKRQMLEFLRLPPMAVADWLDEQLANPLIKAALALPALTGTFCGPRSPGTAANLLIYEASAGGGVEGGAPMLIEALERRARRCGVDIRTSAPVRRILAEGGEVRSVFLESGEELRADQVAASCDPRQTLLELLPPGSIEFRLEQHMQAFRCRGTLAQVLLALDEPIRFAAAPDRRIEIARTGGTMTAIERAFDAIKYRRIAESPALEIHVPTVGTPDLAPEGCDVVSVLVHFAPYELEGGWDEGARNRLGDLVTHQLERYAPGLASSVVGRRVRSPVDIEREYGTTGGHVHHGEHALDQLLVRPAPDCIGYRTPIEGLFLCGAGSHPGGGLTCVPGALASQRMIRGR